MFSCPRESGDSIPALPNIKMDSPTHFHVSRPSCIVTTRPVDGANTLHLKTASAPFARYLLSLLTPLPYFLCAVLNPISRVKGSQQWSLL